MRLMLIRDTFDSAATLGRLYIDSTFFCDTLEDTVRLPGVKIHGATAIPPGTYKLVIDMSTRFGRLMPHVLDVPGFDGIRIHSGNTAVDTEGCILVGHRNGQPDWIGNSRATFNTLFVKMTAAITAKEDVTLTVSNSPHSVIRSARTDPDGSHSDGI